MEKNFIPVSKEVSNLERLRDFRRLTDEELETTQKSLLKDIKEDKIDFNELLTAYGQLNNFAGMDLLF